jgi:hypothetical protein
MEALPLRVLDQDVVDALEADGTALADLEDVVGRLEHARIAEHEEDARGRARDEADRGGEDGDERAFRADERAGEVRRRVVKSRTAP